MKRTNRSKRILSGILSLMLVIGLMPASVAAADSGTLQVHFLDVGQADSILVQLPNSEVMFIDGGNASDAKTIQAYLENQKITKIHHLIATHPHADHIGGLPPIIEAFDVGTIYMPKATHTSQTYEKLLTTIQNKNKTIKTAKAGVSVINTENLKASFVAPVEDTYSNLNNYSAVLKLTYKSNTFLFMGDAETTSENQITADVKADVLKVGHHGSDTSTSKTFLSKVSPQYAVISVGKDNSYGHPSNSVVQALNDAKVTVYRTDTDGTIVMTSDGSKISVTKKATTNQPNAPPATSSNSGTSSSSTAKSGASSSSAAEVQSSTTTSTTVYVTNTGSKYHSSGCQYLSKSKISISLETAKASYEPCSKCNPPR